MNAYRLVFRAWLAVAMLTVLASGAYAQHGEGAEHAAESHGGGSPLAWQTDLAIWTALVFIVLVIVLYKFAWKHIAAGLDKREQNIADNIAAAQRSNEEAKQILAEYEKRLAAAQDEVRAILDEARRDGEHTQREIMAKAQAEAEATHARAMREIDTATSAALKELAEESARLAVELAGKIVRSELDQQRHAGLIEEAMAKFRSAEPSQN